MWNAYIICGNTSFNVRLSLCFDFDQNWNSIEIREYVKEKLRTGSPFYMHDEVIEIMDKVKSIRIHWISTIFLEK